MEKGRPYSAPLALEDFSVTKKREDNWSAVIWSILLDKPWISWMCLTSVLQNTQNHSFFKCTPKVLFPPWSSYLSHFWAGLWGGINLKMSPIKTLILKCSYFYIKEHIKIISMFLLVEKFFHESSRLCWRQKRKLQKRLEILPGMQWPEIQSWLTN